jgi:uncharacterized integral membrane protein
MNLERSLYQRSYPYFIIFFLFVLIGFWLTYFVRILDMESYRMHTHGVALILWCSMLIVQPYLIRTRRYALHKRVGSFSYVLVPLVLFTTLDLLHFRLRNSPLGPVDLAFVALVVNALIVFLILYGLAMYNRRTPAIHARYMICTVFPMFTPVTDRIIHIYFPFLLKYLPTIDHTPSVPVVGFLLGDLILLGLCIWDLALP